MSAVVQVPWCSRFHGGGMEEGPAAVSAALGADEWTTIPVDMEAPPERHDPARECLRDSRTAH